jgi:hypothetical protein
MASEGARGSQWLQRILSMASEERKRKRSGWLRAAMGDNQRCFLRCRLACSLGREHRKKSGCFSSGQYAILV